MKDEDGNIVIVVDPDKWSQEIHERRQKQIEWEAAHGISKKKKNPIISPYREIPPTPIQTPKPSIPPTPIQTPTKPSDEPYYTPPATSTKKHRKTHRKQNPLSRATRLMNLIKRMVPV